MIDEDEMIRQQAEEDFAASVEADSDITAPEPPDPALPVPCVNKRCKRWFKNESGMNHHNTVAHGAKPKTSSALKRMNEVKNKKQKAEPKADNLPAVIEPKKRTKELLVDSTALNSALVLEVMFPDGIPNQKIRATVNWVEATQNLVR